MVPRVDSGFFKLHQHDIKQKFYRIRFPFQNTICVIVIIRL